MKEHKDTLLESFSFKGDITKNLLWIFINLALFINSGCTKEPNTSIQTPFIPPKASLSQTTVSTKKLKNEYQVISPVPSTNTLETQSIPISMSKTSISTPTIEVTNVTFSQTITSQSENNDFSFPDSEIVYSPSSADFDIQSYINQSNGFLSTYKQYLMTSGWTSGADIVQMVALENSINPRLLLTLLEYQSGCILKKQSPLTTFEYPLGAYQYYRKDLYGQLVWAAHELSEGFYGWSNKQLNEISFLDDTIFTPERDTNAGTVALEYLFAQLYTRDQWKNILDPQNGFPHLYITMFGNPWKRATAVEPLIPEGLAQPVLSLPFPKGEKWAYTGGPHPAFENNGPFAALDFAPPTDISGCYQSNDWVVAMADGLVVRSENGVVIQDLDGDGREQTGWVLMYLHIEDRQRIPVGTYLKTGNKIGHPSCQGGRSNGTHVHIARKYNGIWIPADGSIPFVLNGWMAHAGKAPYKGTLTRENQTIIANQFGNFASRILNDEE